jgi:C1A family cysteine protease
LLLRYLRDWWKGQNTGFKKQPEDSRDYQYMPVGGILPSKVDLRDKFLSPRNQGNVQNCTGFASAALFEYRFGQYKEPTYFSTLYPWYFARLLQGWENQNVGVYLRDILKQIYKYGMVYESVMPFKSNYLRAPTRVEKAIGGIALMYLSKTSYYTLTPALVKDALNKGRPVVFGIRINSSFYGNKTGIIKDITPNSSGHAMLCIGYDDEMDYFIVRNSWGSSWGDDGYCYIPQKYFNEQAFDCWTIDEK